MQMQTLGDLPYWKGLWLVISGTTSRCEKELVEDEIKNATKLLKKGLNYFKKFTESSLQKYEKTNPRPRMYDLISKLSHLLNLDAMIASELTLNYMVYEYRNCAETFATQLADLTSLRGLIEELWNFYYSERITLLKCLKLMIEYRDNTNHPYQREFSRFFKEAPLKTFLESSLEQIERLKFNSANSRSHLLSEEHLHKLYNSSLIEMRELLHICTMILDTTRPDTFESLYSSICGEPRRLSGSKSHEDKEIIEKRLEEIRKSQSALYLVILDVKKHSEFVADTSIVETWLRDVRRGMQDTLEHKCLKDSSPEDGPLLLAWMLANYAIEPENSETLNQFRPFGVRAVHLDVFRYLHSLVDTEMVKEETRYAQIVRGSVYNLLSLLCSFMDEEKLSSFDGIFDAVASVLRCPEIAADFWRDKDEEGGLWPLYHRAAGLFPYRFELLTIVANGLAAASPSSAQRITQKLENLTTLTLQVPRHLNTIISRTSTQGLAYRPYKGDCTLHRNDFEIPENCEKIVLDGDLSDSEVILFKIRGKYGDAFHHRIEQLFGHAGGGLMNVSDLQTNLLENIAEGFKLLNSILSADLDIPPGMVIPTELSLEIINRFAYPVLPRNLYKIVASCLQVTSRLVLKYPEDILSRMRVGVYPKFNTGFQEVVELAKASSFDGGLIASWLSGIETIEHRYPVLNAYLDTLSNYLIAKHSTEVMENVEIPGMVFLLQGVLPKLDSWYFTSESERIDLWFKSMFCIHRVLDANLSKNEPRQRLQLVVAYSLLYLEPRHALLKLIRTGERNLRSKMMNETDWISGKGFKIIKSVQLALSLVNRLLMFRKNLGLSHDERSPLEVALYTSPSLPNALLIVPTIVNYLYLEFSPALQAMAVRLLKKFAQGFSMSLLVCMGMDGTAIRGTFASRLMSPTCSVEVKVAILELVAVCLERQPGLTEALFNIMHEAEQKRIFPRPADQFLTEGCSQFLDLYLKRMHNEKEIVCDRLYDNTMNLLRAMWYNRNVILVNFFRKRDKFWTQVFSPLFNPLIRGSRGYAHLIDIATLELFESLPTSSSEDDFTKNLEKLLHKDDHWERIIEYILVNVPVSSGDPGKFDHVEAPLYEGNVEAWYHFIVTLTDAKISSELLSRMAPTRIQFLIKLTLESLSSRIKKTSDISDARVTMLLASLALRCVYTWREKCVEEAGAFTEKIVQLMEDIFHSYSAYGVPLRRILISLLLGCIQLVKSHLSEDRSSLEYLLVHSCLLSNIEVRKLGEKVKETRETGHNPEEEDHDHLEGTKPSITPRPRQECTPAILTISMVTYLLRCHPLKQSPKYAGRSSSLHLRQMVPQLMNCLHETLQLHKFVDFSRAALEFLGTIARSPYYNPCPRPIDDEESIAKLWLGLVPPQVLGGSMLESLYDDRANVGQWRCQDWWQIYSLGLEFLTGLVTNGSSSDQPSIPPTNVTPIILFLGSHEFQLTEVATLLRHTADPLAIDLVQSLVALISALTGQKSVWNVIQPSVRDGLMKCMYLIYDSTVNLLLRPRILKFIIDGVRVESAEDLHFCDEKPPSNELKLLVNKLIIVNWWCAQCFLRFSPRLNALVDTIYTQDFWDTPLAEMNFGPPQMSMSSGPSLTYGTIISSTQLFTQALNCQLIVGPSAGAQASEGIDSAKREWERATPEKVRKLQPKDLKRILNPQLSGYVSGPEVLGHPRLLRRPYDPLIVENTILSRATSFVHHSGRHVSSKNGQSSGPGNTGQLTPSGRSDRTDANPWFSSMNQNNSRLALEVNLVLVLCQTLEGVKSPRLALRDRQLIARETANEIGVFFEFLEQRATGLSEWDIEGALVGVGLWDSTVRAVKANCGTGPLIVRLKEGSTIGKVPVGSIDHDPPEATSREAISLRLEDRLEDDVLTTGAFVSTTSGIRFLSLIGKLFKSMLESLDSAQYG
ncbi:nucleoporin NUP188 homolog [Fopius arisanus]|uniref:NUP188 protein n=1 Tax=Fopius arisanus TaxID=64838 RepID=A0A0C9RG62_9HYME|nr:PREDICTED: nucleoporin NUP188 homolog [Fopius arisanus]